MRVLRPVGARLAMAALCGMGLAMVAGTAEVRGAAGSVCATDPVVTSTADSGAGTLRDAVANACTGSTITFAVTGTIDLTSAGSLEVLRSLTIAGPGADQLTLLNGTTGDYAMLHVLDSAADTVVTISGLTFSGGRHNGAGGGAISNQGGVLTVDGCAFVDNQAAFGGAISSGQGVAHFGTLTILNSTFSGNSVAFSGGAVGIDDLTTRTTIVNSTFSGNVAMQHGGAISTRGPNVTIIGATIAGNLANTGSSGIGVAGGIFTGNASNQPELRNTIVAGNATIGNGFVDVAGKVAATSSSNLIGNDTGLTGVSHGSNGNQIGTAAAPLDPRLGPLQDNGGPTKTRLLLTGSPALDAGDGSLTTAITDQRGDARVLDGPDADTEQTIDIGAVEQDLSIEDIANQTMDEDGSLEVAFNLGDATLGFDSVVATSGNPSIVPSANLAVTGSGSTRTLTLSPAANAFGTAAITVTATRIIGGAPVTASDTFDVTVLPVGELPEALNTTTLVNTPTAPIAIARHAADGAEIVWFRFSGIQNGTVTLATGSLPFGDASQLPVDAVVAAGGVVFTPAADSTAPGQFIVQAVRDGVGNGASPGRIVTIGVIRHSTFTTVSSAPNPSPRLGNVGVSVNVITTTGGPEPTGTVDVSISGSSDTCTATITTGTAWCELTALADPGVDRVITASYGGDTWSAGSTNTTLQTVLTCPRAPVVTNTDDSGAGSLRQAIADACATDSITFAIPGAGPDTIVLASPLFITKHLTVTGPTAKGLILSGDSAVAIAGIDFGAAATFVNLTFRGGVGTQGGAISSHGDLVIVNSTLWGNLSAGGGGAISALDGSLAIYNSTLSGNSAPDQGGAVRTLVPTTLVNATVTANNGRNAIAYFDSLSIQNSIVAGNSPGDLLDAGGTLSDLGNNLIAVDPKLGLLRDNGGPTLTHLPLANSPALDGGNSGAAASYGLTTDQRGVARALAGPGATTASVDIGAAEARASLAFSDATILEDSGFNFVPFGVGDNSLVTSVTATAPNTGVLPSGFGLLTVQGSGATRMLKVAGGPGMYGEVPITITVDTGVESVQGTLMLTIQPVADTPSVSNATTNEDTQTTTGLVIDRSDTDGAVVSHFKITGITNGTLFQHDGVTPIVNGDFITYAQGNAGLRFTPAPDFFGTGSFSVRASIGALDAGLGGAAVTATITVAAVADTASVTDATTNEDTQTPGGLALRVRPNPADGLEVTHFQITGITGGTLFRDDGVTPIANGDFLAYLQINNSLRFTPAPDSIADGHFTVRASIGATAAGLSPGSATATITVIPVADTPSVSSATTRVQRLTTSGLVIARNAVDEAEVTHFKILGVSHGTVYLDDGLTAIPSGSFITVAQGMAGLRFRPDAGFVGTGSFVVQAATDATGSGISPAATATITVDKHDTTTTIASHAPNPSDSGQLLMVGYSVVSTTGGPAPSGLVTVSMGAVSSTCLVSAGQCGLAGVPAGTGQTLTAAYSGDAVSKASTATAIHDVRACGVDRIVTNVNDSGAGSLRQAIADACDFETVLFEIPGAGPHTILLTSGPLVVDRNVNIGGPVDAVVRVSGNHASRVFDVGIASLRLVNLTVVDGAAADGAGLRSAGLVTLVGSTLSGNVASHEGGAVQLTSPDAALQILDSTLSGNSAQAGSAVWAAGSVAVITSTVTANTGAGAVIVNGGEQSGAVNAIIAGNEGPPVLNVGAGVFLDAGGNLLTGDPKLGPLQDNGGPTFTHMPLPGSPAIDHGIDVPFPIDVDQRGMPRLADGPDNDAVATMDIGAVEAVPSVAPVPATSTTEDTPVSLTFRLGDAALGFSSVVATSSDTTLVPNAGLAITGTGGSRTLTVTPAANRSGSATITITATSLIESGFTHVIAPVSATSSFTLTVGTVLDPPAVTSPGAAEDTQTTMVVTPNAADGVEVTHFRVSGIVNGTVFKSDGVTAVASGTFITRAEGAAGLKFTPAANLFSPVTVFGFVVQAAMSAAGAGLGPATGVGVTVTPVADTPAVTNGSTSANQQTASGLVITRNPVDGAEVTHYRITSITGGTLFQHDGTTPIANGAFITIAQGSAGLRFTPASNSTATGHFSVQASLGGTAAGLGGGIVTADITVAQLSSSTTIATSVSPSNPGQSVTFTAAVSGTGPFTGTVEFKDGATALGSPVTLSGGAAAFTTSSLTSGLHAITAQYSGDAAHAGSTGTLAGGQFVRTAVTLSIVSSANPSNPGASVSVQATVVPSAAGSPTGSIVFKEGSTTLATRPIASGAATLTTSALAIGVHHLTIEYGGDATFANASTTFDQIVSGGRALLTGADAGAGPHVRRFNAIDGSTPSTGALTSFFPFNPGFTGGVRVAEGDVNGDGVPDPIAAAGAGGAPEVRVYDGATGTLLRSVLAFEPSFAGGVYVAAGDVNGDGYSDVIAGSGPGRSGEVKVFSGRDGAVLRDAFVFDRAFMGGVRVAAGDVNGDGSADLVVGTGPGTSSAVTILSGSDLSVLRSLSPYGAFPGGVFVAAGDVTGDGFADVITGADAGGGPHVQVFDGVSGSVGLSFFAFAPTFTGGVRVAAGDVTGDGKAEVIVGAGPGGTPDVRVFDGATAALLSTQLAYPSAFPGGLFVATVVPQHRMVIERAGSGGGTSGAAGADADRRPNMIAGWAFVENTRDAGISAVHVYAQPVSGGAAILLGIATLGDARPDVADRYGPQYANAGFHLAFNASLLPLGNYDIVVFAQSARTGTFQIARVTRIARTP